MRPLLSAALCAAFVSAAYVVAFCSARSVFFGFGPADHSYVTGFRVGWDRETTARWSRENASVSLPLRVRGDAELVVVGGRPGRDPMEIAIEQDDRLLERVLVGPREAIYSFPLSNGAASFRFVAERADGGHGLHLEGLRLVPRKWAALVPAPAAVVRAFVAALLFALGFGLAGLSSRASALATTALFGLPLAALGFFDAFASVHWLAKGAVFSSVATLLLATCSRGPSRFRSLVLAFAILSGSFALFHPAYSFKDVEIHREVTDVVRTQGASELWSRMEFYQQKYGLGRASLEGQRRPMPYPPVLHTLAGWFPFGETEDVLKSFGILLHALTVGLIMVMTGSLVEGVVPAVAAGVLASLFPDSVLELLRASYAAILGHLVDLAVVFLLFRRWNALRSAKGVIGLGIAFALCAVDYNASPLNLAVFLPLVLLAAVLPESLPGWRGLVAASALGGLLSLGYYGPFVFDLLRSSERSAETTLSFSDRFAAATIGWDAFGPIYVIAGFFGLVRLLRTRWHEPGGRVLLGWALYAVAISVPVFLAPEPLYYFRRLMFVYPLGPILVAAALSRRPVWLVLATFLLVATSLHRIGDYYVPFYVTHTGSLAQ